MKKYTDQQIIDSYKKNYQYWITAIQESEIESRLLVTNQAIIDAIYSRKPKTLLDIGCGEGWLVRECTKAGISSFGVDVVPDLIDYAQKQSGGRFKTLSYEELSSSHFEDKFDVVVNNFSLLGNESVNRLFEQIPALLTKSGAYIVQTVHTLIECGEEKYQTGWRSGFSKHFSDPAPWYFRTIDNWKNLFLQNGFILKQILEPFHPVTRKPASIIFIGELSTKKPLII